MIYYGNNSDIYLCEEVEEGRLRLCRAFGTKDIFDVPKQVGDGVITTIGAYCFAQRARLTKGQLQELEQAGLGDGTTPTSFGVRPMNGSYLKAVTLPETVTTLETYAFFDCRNLEELTVGPLLTQIHSDAFMNCRGLHLLNMKASIACNSGLKALLNQLTAELTVTFMKEDGFTQAKILYPEYTESYEEIGPAHIFSLHVEGEGYRVRKQFAEGRPDLQAYDAVFEKACNEEQLLTLMKMAIYRLTYPIDLSEEAKKRYLEYVRGNEIAIMEILVKMQDEVTLEYLCGQPLISDEAVCAAIVRGVSEGWTKGVAGMIRWRNALQREE